MAKRPSTILVAMSGGVDSSLTAALLKEEGWTVHGIHFVIPGDAGAVQKRLGKVLDVAGYLQVPIVDLDLRQVFSKKVIDPFVQAYCQGVTPNPCVICNEVIKFHYLQEYADHHGIEFVATGHYARIRRGPRDKAELWRGAAGGKEQSYFLHRLTGKILSRTRFPLALFTKKEVRRRARAMGIPIGTSESQEICFLPNPDYRRLVEEKTGHMPETAGSIVDAKGNFLGSHRGTHRYTIGQRHGLRIASSRPYYVKELRPRENIVVVGRREDLYSQGLRAESFAWVGDPLSGRVKGVLAQIRYRHRAAPGTLEVDSPEAVRFVFEEPQWAITPGQALVCYDGERVLGGGWITTGVEG